MKRLFWRGILLLMLLLPMTGRTQTLRMEEAQVAFTYPDTWQVVSPQLCTVYEPVLKAAGLDVIALSDELEDQHVLSRGYKPGYQEFYQVLTRDDDLAIEIFQMDLASQDDRKRIRRQVENNDLWESTGFRTQDTAWQVEGGRYWLYIHYLKTISGNTVGRGIRYLTVFNGKYLIIDWQRAEGRFTNRELSSFRGMLSGVFFLEMAKEPIRRTVLEAELPTESNKAEIKITGTATPEAVITLSALKEYDQEATQVETVASARGSFTVSLKLYTEGNYDLTLSAAATGMLENTMSSALFYSEKTIPVSGIPEVQTVTEDKVVVSGTTLGGTALQLVTPFGLSKKRSANDGSFSFELSTEDEGTYNYTLILDRSGYVQRRIQFTIVRIKTDDQQRSEIRRTAVKIAYRELQKNLERNTGKVLSLYGPVEEVSTGGENTYIRLMFNRDTGNKWYNPVVIVTDQKVDVKAGDMLTAVVRVAGVYEEQDNGGNMVNIPRLELLFIDRVD